MKVYFVSLNNEDTGEVEGMFNMDGICLGWWACNDAMWRSEYFNTFMRCAGVEVIDRSGDPVLEGWLYQEVIANV